MKRPRASPILLAGMSIHKKSSLPVFRQVFQTLVQYALAFFGRVIGAFFD